MKTWNEIKRATLDKLFLKDDDDDDEVVSYKSRFLTLANECLMFIANGVKPKISERIFTVTGKFVNGTGFTIVDNKIHYTCGDTEYTIDPEEDVLYVDGKTKYIYRDSSLHLRDEYKDLYLIDEPVTMPDDFLSFANMVNYRNNCPDPEIHYLTDKSFYCEIPGDYVIYYNGLYQTLTDEDTNNINGDRVLDIDSSVLSCLPSYLASQCLSQDDIQRSSILKNEFELLLSRLDTNVLYESEHFKSEGGWY